MLGIRSQEVFPKIGYTMMQVLSSSAIAYGAILYYTGDDLTQQAERLHALELSLNSTRMSQSEKNRILDQSSRDILSQTQERRAKVRKIRGILEVTTAACTAATLAFSNTSGTASNVALGFIFLVSAAGGVSDLTSSDTVTHFSDLSQHLVPGSGPQLAMSFHW